MLSHKTSIDRMLAGTIISMMIVFLSINLYFTHHFSTLEFKYSKVSCEFEKQRHKMGWDPTPVLATYCRDFYPYSRLSLIIAVLWAALILRKQKCSLMMVMFYVGVFINYALFWTLFTFLALYMENQTFYFLD
jgi:hypothetical protein